MQQLAVESKGEASVTSVQAPTNDADKKNDGAEEFRSILQSLIDKELARGVDPVTAVHNINKAGIFVNAQLVPANDPQEQNPIKEKYQEILQKMLDEELKKGVTPLTALRNIQKSGALANTRIVPLNTEHDDTFIVIPAGKPFNRYAYRPIFDSPAAPAFYKPANYYPEVSPYVRRPAYQQDQYYVRNYYNPDLPVMRRPTFYAADQEQRPYSRPVYSERPTFAAVRRTYNPEQYFRQGSFEAYPLGQTERFYPEQAYDMIEPAQSAPRPYSPRPFYPTRPQFVPDQF